MTAYPLREETQCLPGVAKARHIIPAKYTTLKRAKLTNIKLSYIVRIEFAYQCEHYSQSSVLKVCIV